MLEGSSHFGFCFSKSLQPISAAMARRAGSLAVAAFIALVMVCDARIPEEAGMLQPNAPFPRLLRRYEEPCIS